jgi:predicted O-methyltransferase YrrM
MSRTTLAMTDSLRDYLLSVSLRDTDVLRRQRDETATHPSAGMQSSPEQGQFLRLIIELMGARKVLEIGVFCGFSALSVALGMPEDGKIIACDVSEEYTSIARRYWREAGVESKIDLRIAPALETLKKLRDEGLAGTFDFVFIDADKSNYLAYYEESLELLRSGGLIAIDNTLWNGRVADPNVTDADTVALRALNEKLHHDERVSLSMLPIGDGLTLALKRG